jgi:hypothetical protein
MFQYIIALIRVIKKIPLFYQQSESVHFNLEAVEQYYYLKKLVQTTVISFDMQAILRLNLKLNLILLSI